MEVKRILKQFRENALTAQEAIDALGRIAEDDFLLTGMRSKECDDAISEVLGIPEEVNTEDDEKFGEAWEQYHRGED